MALEYFIFLCNTLSYEKTKKTAWMAPFGKIYLPLNNWADILVLVVELLSITLKTCF